MTFWKVASDLEKGTGFTAGGKRLWKTTGGKALRVVKREKLRTILELQIPWCREFNSDFFLFFGDFASFCP